MAFNNFIIRSIISISLLIFYLLIYIYEKDYIIYFVFLIYLLILLEVSFYFNKFRFLIILYLLISLTSVVYTNLISENILIFNLLLVTIISFDIFSYLVGSKFGKNKILKNISPNKTLEGLVGGITFSIISSSAYSFFVKIKLNSELYIVLVIIIFLSFAGDITESFFKRKNKLKNSSNYLPGHGGFFDRFDGFVLSILPFSYYCAIL